MHVSGEMYPRKTVWMLVAVASLSFALVVWVLADSRRTTWQYAAGSASNLVKTLQHDVARAAASVDHSIVTTVQAVNVLPIASMTAETRRRFLFDRSVGTQNFGNMFLMDEHGFIVSHSAGSGARPENYADRDFFATQRDQPDAGLVISRPYRSVVSGQWSIALTRRVNGPSGQFAGVVGGAMRFPYFDELFSTLTLQPESTVSLYGIDGTLIYRTPFNEADIGRDLSAGSVFRKLRAGESGPYDEISIADGRAKLFVFAQVGTLPLVLAINTPLDTIYAEWRVKAWLVAEATCVLALMGLLGLRTLQSQRHRLAGAELARARSATILGSLFDTSPDALFVVEVAPAGTLTYQAVNPAFEALTGLSAHAIRGKQPAELFDGGIAGSIVERTMACVTSGRTQTFSDERFLAGGRGGWHTILAPIRDGDGVVTRVLGSARDMTELTRLQAERQEVARIEAVGRLTAGIAHDFNNYLQTIVSSVDLLEADHLSGPEEKELAKVAQKAASSGARLVQHLLAFSRQQVLQPRRVSVAGLLGETRKLIGTAALGPALRLKIAVEPFTEDIQVDPVQAESCLLNLLLNGRDAMPEGGTLVLHARNARRSDGIFGTVGSGRHVIIAVQDTGAGMDEDTRLHAFEPFFTTKKFGHGSGLGLSMVHGFCRQSGGDVRILDGGTGGTRVELWLPAASADALVEEERELNVATIGSSTGRVLLVDDEYDVSLALSAILISAGFEVVVANNGAEGLLRLADRDPYDLLLTDYAMPDMTGTQFLTHAAKLKPFLPMMMLTGYDLREVAMPELPLPLQILHKPIRGSTLLNAVREAIGENKDLLAA